MGRDTPTNSAIAARTSMTTRSTWAPVNMPEPAPQPAPGSRTSSVPLSQSAGIPAIRAVARSGVKNSRLRLGTGIESSGGDNPSRFGLPQE